MTGVVVVRWVGGLFVWGGFSLFIEEDEVRRGRVTYRHGRKIDKFCLLTPART